MNEVKSEYGVMLSVSETSQNGENLSYVIRRFFAYAQDDDGT